MKDDHRFWGLSLSLSQPHQHPPSPPHPHPHPPLPIEYMALPFSMHMPQQTPLSVPPYPHPPPIMPFQSYETIQHPKQDEEGQDQEPEEHEDSQSPPAPVLNNNDIEPPFPWATCKRATIHTMQHLSSHGLTTITGKVKCRRCSVERDIGYNLAEKFASVANFIVENKSDLNHRASGNWENPVLPNCESCGNENCMKPVISNNNEGINWLFLLLGEMIGCCNLKHLKYFCKYMNTHSSGAKNRLIYYTYLGLCKQLVPNGHFDP